MCCSENPERRKMQAGGAASGAARPRNLWPRTHLACVSHPCRRVRRAHAHSARNFAPATLTATSACHCRRQLPSPRLYPRFNPPSSHHTFAQLTMRALCCLFVAAALAVTVADARSVSPYGSIEHVVESPRD